MNQGGATNIKDVGKIKPSPMYEKMSGSAGDRVVAHVRGGLATRAKPRYKYPKIAAVQAGNVRLSAINAAWNAMSLESIDRWNLYAERLPLRRSFSGDRYALTGKNALLALGTRFLMANPGMPLPLDPPTEPYIVPTIKIEVAGFDEDSLPSGRGGGGVENALEEETDGLLLFTSPTPTPEGTVVELLVQRLVNNRRKPGTFYKSTAFVTFTEEEPTVAIPMQVGWVACAYRLVERSTGCSGGMMPLGKVEIV